MLTQTVLAPTTTSLVFSLNPSTTGQAVTFTATFTATVTGSGGAPTGTVTFLDGATPLATVTLALGKASFTTSTLANGAHQITARYSGDSSFAGSTYIVTIVL